MALLLNQAWQILRGPTRKDPCAMSTPSVCMRMVLTLLCGMIYGSVLGSFGGLSLERFVQVIFSAVKVPMLLLVTFAISLPSFFVLNTLLGLRSDFSEVLRALVSGQAGLTIVLASLAPYTLLWYASSGSYEGAQLFNGLMFAVATFTAQSMVRSWYRPLIVRDRRHRWLLRAWLILYTFVAVQMAWVLRPFIGAPGMSVQFFREESWGNAYVIFGRMVWGVISR